MTTLMHLSNIGEPVSTESLDKARLRAQTLGVWIYARQ